MVQCIKNLSYLSIHVGDRGIVSSDGLLLPADVHFHVDTGAVIDAGFRDVFPVVLDLGREDHLAVGKEGLVVGTGGDEGNVWADEAHPEPEGLL